MNRILSTAALITALSTTSVFADAEAYVLDSSHSQVLFSYNHVGYSTTWGMFSGFEGQIMFDVDEPAASSVSVSIPVMSMYTGWEQRLGHFMSAEFFNAEEGDMITFESTGIEVTGENTALITGDMTANDITVEVILDTVLNAQGEYPVPPFAGAMAAGFTATTSILRSDFDLGAFAPFISDEVEIVLSIEAMRSADIDS
jgi:polyisoprenoid-binding protein YceI